MKIFYRTTAIRISLLFLAIYAISFSIVKNEWLYTAVGSLLLLIRESIYNVELYHGMLHYLKSKLSNEKEIETIDVIEALNHI